MVEVRAISRIAVHCFEVRFEFERFAFFNLVTALAMRSGGVEGRPPTRSRLSSERVFEARVAVRSALHCFPVREEWERSADSSSEMLFPRLSQRTRDRSTLDRLRLRRFLCCFWRRRVKMMETCWRVK